MDIRIEWEGVFSLKDLDKDGSEKVLDTDIDYGIYQIYGTHPVYGTDVLLYIGQANNQTFRTRIKQEKWWWYNQDSKNIKVYVGRLFGEKQPSHNDWAKMIDYAEKVLIYSHAPAYNSSNIFSVSRDKKVLEELEDIRVFNFDEYRSLMPEISGEVWVKEEDYTSYIVFENN